MQNEAYSSHQENENIFRILIEESPAPMGLYVGREMVIKLANKAILKVWGKDESVIGNTFSQTFPELEGTPYFKVLDDVYATGQAYEAVEEEVDLEVDGQLQTCYCNFTFKPLKNASGEVWGIINTLADVTQLVNTRKKLLEQEKRTQFILDSAEIGTWDIDRVNNTILWNDRCRELYGFPEGAEVNRLNVRDHVHPDDADRITESVRIAIDPETGGDYDDTFRIIDSVTKEIRWVKCKGRAYFNEAGICTRFSGTTLDITNDVKIREEQQKLLTLIDNTAEIISVVNLDTEVIYLNKAGYAVLGIDDPAKLTRPAREYYMPEDAERLYSEAVPQVMETGSWTGELNYRNLKTGESIPVHINLFTITDPANGKVTGRAAVARDLRPEQEARSEQFKLLSLIENSSDFISLSDIDGNVTYVNAAGRKMLGINKEAIFRHNSEYIMPGEIDRLKNEVNKALFENGRWSGRINYRHFETGEMIPVYGTTMLVYDNLTKKIQGRASVARDLRREIADKKALIDSEQLLKNITKASPTGLWMTDEQGNMAYVNQTWIDWTGLSFEQSMGDGWTTAIIDEDRDRVLAKYKSDLNLRASHEVDLRIKHKNGFIRWCIATANPQYSSDGRFLGYIGACVDVSEKIRIEKQLKINNDALNDQIKQYEFVTGFMPVQLWTATADGISDYVNARTVEYFGKTAEEILGSPGSDFIHPEDFEKFLKVWEHSLKTGAPYQFEFRLRDKHGIYKWHLARALPFYIDGKIAKWFGTNTDIDDQKQLQHQKDDFLGIASHELKTPVTSIKAYAQVLGAMLNKEGETKKAEMVARMDAQVNRLTNLIGDLLDVTKINSGRLQFNKTRFDFNLAIKEAMDDLQHTTNRHTLIADFTETGEIYSDKDRISQVITNLITNAIKYSPHSDKIIVSTKLENKEVTVCVQDFGIGIPEDKADRVFEQFYRVSGNKQHTFPGLGLGLYISSEIVKREGGRMWVNSVEGKGSTFCFALPANDKPVNE
jgi:PAS domain S-box-containing protein